MRRLEGIAVPYGVSVDLGGGLSEIFAPGAFAADVASWAARSDGARVPFVSSHPGEGSRAVIGTVVELRDTPEGLRFTAELAETSSATEYAELAGLGANGVSVEFSPLRSRRRHGGSVVEHLAARLHAIAGAIAPAYDTARVAVRSRRDYSMVEERQEPPAEEPDAGAEEIHVDEVTVTVSRSPETPEEPEEEPEAGAPVVARARMTTIPGARLGPTEPERRARETSAVARMTGAGPLHITRSELVYTREGEHRFLRDGMRAASGDMAAMERLGRHYAILADVAKRAALSTNVAGAYPTEYLPGLFTERVIKGRPAGSFFRRIPITDATPKTFARVTTGTTVAKQSAEGTNVAAGAFATSAVNATPEMYQGAVDVSRQVIDGADPDAERMILDDLTEAYMQASEAAIVAAIEAGATASATAVSAATPHAGVVGNIVKFQQARFLPAEGVLAPPAVYEGLLLQNDTAGRALVPWLGPTNAQGQAEAGAAGASVLGVPVFLSWASTATLTLIARRDDAHYYESAMATFRYEQIGGPGLIRVGLWAYLAAVVRNPAGVYKATVGALLMADESAADEGRTAKGK